MVVRKCAICHTDKETDSKRCAECDTKAVRKERITVKVLSVVILGTMTILCADAFARFSEDPVYALLCVVIGFPAMMLTVIGLFREKPNVHGSQ